MPMWMSWMVLNLRNVLLLGLVSRGSSEGRNVLLNDTTVLAGLLSTNTAPNAAGNSWHADVSFLYVKRDCAEITHTHGLPPHNDGLRPCPECPAFGDSFFVFLSVGHLILSFSWREHDDDVNDIAFNRCEKMVVVTAESHQAILDAGLRYSKKMIDFTMCGRLLNSDVPALGLLREDRLEPCNALPNTGDFEKLEPTSGVTAVLWRAKQDTLCRHRNP